MANKTATATIDVMYRFIEGYHVFTSKDMYGLYIADKDSKTAFNRIAPSIEKLVKLSLGVKCLVEPAVSYTEFLRRIEQEEQDIPHPAILESRQFVLKCAA